MTGAKRRKLQSPNSPEAGKTEYRADVRGSGFRKIGGSISDRGLSAESVSSN